MNPKFELMNVFYVELRQSSFRAMLGYNLLNMLDADINNIMMSRAITHDIESVLWDAV